MILFEGKPLPPLAVGDKVRHLRDIEKGYVGDHICARYGLGTVLGQDEFGDWVVNFPQRNFEWERTFARHWIEKVEA
jgi:hypothetical protein